MVDMVEIGKCEYGIWLMLINGVCSLIMFICSLKKDNFIYGNSKYFISLNSKY